MGAPGTGKTLLARAVAGEANVPFFSISGSDFVEMFVGVGASRVRDLFEQGKKNAPCIVFIDEIDAVGRHRGAGLGGGHDEREQTLNQLLVEMDGFESNEGVILVAATNRPDVLDPALLRPGRFDRRIVVNRPDVKGREGILGVHTRKIPLSDDVNISVLARGTAGFSGADLANLVNEAALYAARFNQKVVRMLDFEFAKDKVLMGTERKSMIISDAEKRVTAVHEAGHALLTVLLPGADPIHKVTIIPRGMALGLTQQLPVDEKHNLSRAYLEDQIAILLGGRIAEEVTADNVTTGAGNDLERVTDLARRMVCEWGMSQSMGPLTFGKKEEQIFLGREIAQHQDYSEDTAIKIDQEVKGIVTTQYERAHAMLTEHREALIAHRRGAADPRSAGRRAGAPPGGRRHARGGRAAPSPGAERRRPTRTRGRGSATLAVVVLRFSPSRNPCRRNSRPRTEGGPASPVARLCRTTLHARRLYTVPLPGGRRLELGERTLVMAVINLTPDSFAERAPSIDPARALDLAQAAEAQGADILDLGAESTRPGAAAVEADEELRRLLPALRAIAARARLPISVDTTKAAVARAALDEGAAIVNDISGLRYDPGLGRVVAAAGAALVLMHMRGRPAEMYREAVVRRCRRGGARRTGRAPGRRPSRPASPGRRPSSIPAWGSPSAPSTATRLLARLAELAALDRPILVGSSRKSFLTRALGDVPPEAGTGARPRRWRLPFSQGAHIVRVHAVGRWSRSRGSPTRSSGRGAGCDVRRYPSSPCCATSAGGTSSMSSSWRSRSTRSSSWSAGRAPCRWGSAPACSCCCSTCRAGATSRR